MNYIFIGWCGLLCLFDDVVFSAALVIELVIGWIYEQARLWKLKIIGPETLKVKKTCYLKGNSNEKLIMLQKLVQTLHL